MPHHLLCRDALAGGTPLNALHLLTFDFLLTNARPFQGYEQNGERVVRERDEVPLGVGGGVAVCPRLLLTELILGDIEDFFDLPTQKIEQGDEPWSQRQVRRQKDEAFATERIAIGDPAQMSVGVADLVVRFAPPGSRGPVGRSR